MVMILMMMMTMMVTMVLLQSKNEVFEFAATRYKNVPPKRWHHPCTIGSATIITQLGFC
jgi:hypothetical protein